MGKEKIKLICLVLFVFLVLFSCGSREVLKNTSSQESNTITENKEQLKSNDSATANIQRLSENTSFELEPIGDKLAYFTYIVGKDTVRVETSGKLMLNNAKNKEESKVFTTSNLEVNKDEKADIKTKEKTKQTDIKRENNSFQFILLGMLIVILVQIGWRQIKNKFWI